MPPKADRRIDFQMDPLIIALVLATFLFSAFLKGTAGLGFATTCLGVMASYLDLRTAIPLVIIPSIMSNLLVMIEAGNFLRILRLFKVMLAATIPGLLLGMWVLSGADSAIPRGVLGTAMILYGLWGLWGKPFQLDHNPVIAACCGFVTGVVNGLTGSQIMPVLPYLMSLPITKDELVQAINTSFTFSSLIMLVGMGRFGLLSVDVIVLSATGIVPVALGIWIGGKVRRRLPEAVFRRLVLILLCLLGLGLVGRAFL